MQGQPGTNGSANYGSSGYGKAMGGLGGSTRFGGGAHEGVTSDVSNGIGKPPIANTGCGGGGSAYSGGSTRTGATGSSGLIIIEY